MNVPGMQVPLGVVGREEGEDVVDEVDGAAVDDEAAVDVMVGAAEEIDVDELIPVVRMTVESDVAVDVAVVVVVEVVVTLGARVVEFRKGGAIVEDAAELIVVVVTEAVGEFDELLELLAAADDDAGEPG